MKELNIRKTLLSSLSVLLLRKIVFKAPISRKNKNNFRKNLKTSYQRRQTETC
ncbi:hypothetical protein V6Z11_D01G183500 [Gossypium hirsutum]